jgi:hypothetical protein
LTARPTVGLVSREISEPQREAVTPFGVSHVFADSRDKRDLATDCVMAVPTASHSVDLTAE